jgi:hypothetical protein
VVVGRLPQLPFRDESFDVMTPGFIVPHVASFADASLKFGESAGTAVVSE